MDIYLDRDNLKKVGHVDDEIKVIMNGWFTDKPENWPPSPLLNPLFVSFNISPHIAWRFLRRKVIEYLKQHEPIGCRDIWTMKLLKAFGIEAYFSGCLTLTLDYKYNINDKDEKFLVIDIDPKLTRYVRNIILLSLIHI